ncbi:MAG TPA: hypothetical protein DDZ66_07220 [Firmicutes bacterium]|nr:hypothetical protein [Bacillota bacterium]
MTRSKLTAFIVACLLLITAGGACGTEVAKAQSRAKVAMTLHENAWIDVADRAKSDPAYKYAIYQSRTIAVKHPEIYLQADALFNEILTSEKNMGAYYLNRTQDLMRQEEEYREIQHKGGDGFKWSSFSIENHNPVGYKEMYHTEAFMPFIDIRLHFMGSSLKGTDWQATPLSMAEFLYFQNGAKKNSFLIVTGKGTAYLYSPPGLFSKEKLVRYDGEETEQIEETVVLIFNEDYVWYPLMDRDDRNESTRLLKLVETYAEEGQVPKLTAVEKGIVEKLRQHTGFDSKTDELFALAYAAKLHATTWDYHREIFKELYPRYSAEYGFGRHAPSFISYRNAHVAWLSNLISPITAELAAIARENVGSRSLNRIVAPMVAEHMKYTETNNGRTNLNLWHHSELHYLNIDDNLLSKAGNCIYSATNSAAMLDLAAIPNLEIYVAGLKYEKRGGGHAYTVIFRNGQYGTLENGDWAPDFNGLYDSRFFSREGTVISAVTLKNGWINFTNESDVDIREITTSLEKSEVLTTLESFRDKTREQTKIGTEHSSNKAIQVYDISTFISRFPRMEITQMGF